MMPMPSLSLLACVVLSTLCLGCLGASSVLVSDAVAFGSSTYTTGTCGTGGVSTTTLTGVGTAWTAGMAGAMVTFTASGSFRQVVRVSSATMLEMDTPITLTGTGNAYSLAYSGMQTGTSSWLSDRTYVGVSSTSSAFAYANTLNVVGPAWQNTGVNFYLNDQYATCSLVNYVHDNIHLTFDASFSFTGGVWVSSTGNGAHRIHKSYDMLLLETSGAVPAGNNIPSWTAYMKGSNNGQVTFPLNQGVKFETAGGTPSALNYFETFDTVWTLTSPCATGFSVNVTISRIGNRVTIHLGEGHPCYVIKSASILGFNLVPSRFRPKYGRSSFGTLFPMLLTTIPGSQESVPGGLLFPDTAGSVFIFQSFDGGQGAPSGPFVGWSPFAINYLV